MKDRLVKWPYSKNLNLSFKISVLHRRLLVYSLLKTYFTYLLRGELYSTGPTVVGKFSLFNRDWRLSWSIENMKNEIIFLWNFKCEFLVRHISTEKDMLVLQSVRCQLFNSIMCHFLLVWLVVDILLRNYQWCCSDKQYLLYFYCVLHQWIILRLILYCFFLQCVRGSNRYGQWIFYVSPFFKGVMSRLRCLAVSFCHSSFRFKKVHLHRLDLWARCYFMW